MVEASKDQLQQPVGMFEHADWTRVQHSDALRAATIRWVTLGSPAVLPDSLVAALPQSHSRRTLLDTPEYLRTRRQKALDFLATTSSC